MFWNDIKKIIENENNVAAKNAEYYYIIMNRTISQITKTQIEQYKHMKYMEILTIYKNPKIIYKMIEFDIIQNIDDWKTRYDNVKWYLVYNEVEINKIINLWLQHNKIDKLTDIF